MFNLGMVDTAGGGIRKLFLFQTARFFPLPDYDISNRRVKLTLTGKVLNQDYARLLAGNSDLDLLEVMALDKLQKKRPLNAEEINLLKAKSLIEGRKPNYYLAKSIAEKIGEKAAYSKNTALNKQYYLDFICKSIEEHDSLTRKDADELLWDKLPDWMSDKQKKYKIGNLLGELRRNGRIQNQSSMKKSIWVLVK